jgi:hypothetical protein
MFIGDTQTQALPLPTMQATMAVPTQTARSWTGKGWPWL